MLYWPSCSRILLIRRWSDRFYLGTPTLGETFVLASVSGPSCRSAPPLTAGLCGYRQLRGEAQRRLPAPARLLDGQAGGTACPAGRLAEPAAPMPHLLPPMIGLLVQRGHRPRNPPPQR